MSLSFFVVIQSEECVKKHNQDKVRLGKNFLAQPYRLRYRSTVRNSKKPDRIIWMPRFIMWWHTFDLWTKKNLSIQSGSFIKTDTLLIQHFDICSNYFKAPIFATIISFWINWFGANEWLIKIEHTLNWVISVYFSIATTKRSRCTRKQCRICGRSILKPTFFPGTKKDCGQRIISVLQINYLVAS